ncbi:hypothetical protein RR49_01188 [Microbacterium ginsengisoli]|uniref:Holliday junction resolvase n=1 Tax=Microbacterium ginsengisoli TaxID=400772 RepID=A0A0F0M0A3_9MICO|nr:hypothetical protein [Microbacterium ginsengisoli]KJL37076.1 hypothetical protein RR49_01188 [Microbacterium ginsengisoli]
MGSPILPDPVPEQVQTDTVGAPPPRRNRTSARKAGSSFERSIADWLASRLNDDRIDRRVKRGVKDRGDITGVRTIRGGRVVIEAKNTTRIDLSGWLREAEAERGNDDAVVGLVVHKRRGIADPAEQYVTMRLEGLAVLLEGGFDA